MKFWYGSGTGSADPYLYLWLMDPDADLDPVIFVSDLQDVNKNDFFCLLPYLLKVHLHHFSKIKIHTEVSIEGINVFLNNFACFVLYPYLWLMDPDADPGGSKTYGSYGSGFRYATLVLRSFKVVWHKQEGENEEVVGSLETSEYILGKNWRDLIPVIKVQYLVYTHSVGT